MKSPPTAAALRGAAEPGAYSDVSQKLMASMGWKEGKGLGKQEQGNEKYIESKKRGDNVGLGADATIEAQFAAGLHKGAGKAAFGDQSWVDAFAGALDAVQDRHASSSKKKKKKKKQGAMKDSAENFLDSCFAATGGKRLGMRSQRSDGGKLRRIEAADAVDAAFAARAAAPTETPEERQARRKARRKGAEAAAPPPKKRACADETPAERKERKRKKKAKKAAAA